MFGITIETDADKGNCQKLWLSKAESNFQSEAPLPPKFIILHVAPWQTTVLTYLEKNKGTPSNRLIIDNNYWSSPYNSHYAKTQMYVSYLLQEQLCLDRNHNKIIANFWET